MSKSSINTHKTDYALLVTVVALLTIGLMMIYSTTFVLGFELHGQALYYVLRQLVWMGLGLGIMLLFMRIEYHMWQRWSVPFMALSLGLMVLVLLVGQVTFGGQRWLFNGSVQPSELSKLAVIIYIADWLSSKGHKIRQMSDGLIPFAILSGLITGLIVLQQDLSTAVLVGLTALTMFFVAGASLVQLGTIGLFGMMSFVILVLAAPYRLARLSTLLDPLNTDPLGQGYQIRQILIALGSGGIFGVGLGESRQKFGYIPAAHTDGIFAIIGEELGFVGCMVVLGLFGLLTYRGLKIALASPDSFGNLLAVGLTSSLIIQAAVNIGVVTAIFPFTGVPLPFISFGGSSLVVSMATIGLLLSISRRTKPEKAARRLQKKERHESSDLWRGNWRPRLSRPIRRPRPKTTTR